MPIKGTAKVWKAAAMHLAHTLQEILEAAEDGLTEDVELTMQEARKLLKYCRSDEELLNRIERARIGGQEHGSSNSE